MESRILVSYFLNSIKAEEATEHTMLRSAVFLALVVAASGANHHLRSAPSGQDATFAAAEGLEPASTGPSAPAAPTAPSAPAVPFAPASTATADPSAEAKSTLTQIRKAVNDVSASYGAKMTDIKKMHAETAAAILAKAAPPTTSAPTTPAPTTSTTPAPTTTTTTTEAPWVHLPLNTPIEAEWGRSKKFYAAKVASVNKDTKTYNVLFDDGDKRNNLAPDQVRKQVPCPLETEGYNVDAQVKAKWGKSFYDGKISKVRNANGKCTYDITFADGDKKYQMVPENIKVETKKPADKPLRPICQACVDNGFRSMEQAQNMQENDCTNTVITELVKAKKGSTRELQGISADTLVSMIVRGICRTVLDKNIKKLTEVAKMSEKNCRDAVIDVLVKKSGKSGSYVFDLEKLKSEELTAMINGEDYKEKKMLEKMGDAKAARKDKRAEAEEIKDAAKVAKQEAKDAKKINDAKNNKDNKDAKEIIAEKVAAVADKFADVKDSRDAKKAAKDATQAEKEAEEDRQDEEEDKAKEKKKADKAKAREEEKQRKEAEDAKEDEEKEKKREARKNQRNERRGGRRGR